MRTQLIGRIYQRLTASALAVALTILVAATIWFVSPSRGLAQDPLDLWHNAPVDPKAGVAGLDPKTGLRRIRPNAPPLDLSQTSANTLRKTTAVGARTVGWSDLLPPHRSSEAPFASLPPHLLQAMRTHVRWRTSRPNDRTDPAFVAVHDAALSLLSSHDIDVESLMKQRRQIIVQNGQAGRGPNRDLVGNDVRLPGYIVPLEFAGQLVTEFLFVPVAGSCVHTPTPPANQIVRVSYPAGFPFTSIYDAFWIEGELKAADTISDVMYYDGAANVEAIYALTAQTVAEFDS